MKYPLVTLGMLLVASQTQAYTLDFGNGPEAPSICTGTNYDGSGAQSACVNYAAVSEAYGDVAGVVDVNYSSPEYQSPTTLRWWNSNYNDLYGVLWSASGPAHVDFTPTVAGTLITLNSFDMGAYPGKTGQTTVTVSTLDGTVLQSYSGPIGVGSTSHFTWNTPVSSTTGLRIEFKDEAYNVGIDNINFTVGAVPEPSTYALMFAGLIGMGAVARRRRQ